MFQRVLVASVVLVIGLCAPAFAQGGYAGASWLSSGAEFETAFDDFDTDDSGWKVFLGYDFARFLGIELSYRDLGDFTETSGLNTIDAEVTAYDGSLRGVVPLGKMFEVFGKLGYSTVSVDLTAGDGLSSISAEDEDWELFYGVGVGLKLGERLGIRAEWEEWDVDTKLNAFSVGGYLRF